MKAIEQVISSQKTELEGFGARLSQAIARTGLSQNEFSRRVGVSSGFMNDMVRDRKRPGAEVLLAIHNEFGISIDWLLTGEGTASGLAAIDAKLFRVICLQVALARTAVAAADSGAQAILKLIWEDRLQDAFADPGLKACLARIVPDGADAELAVTLYNSYLWIDDPASQRRGLLTAALAHFEARQPPDNLALLASSLTAGSGQGAAIQINIGMSQRIAGGNYFESTSSHLPKQGKRS